MRPLATLRSPTARQLVAGQRRSLGTVISELARRGLTPALVEADRQLPVIRRPPRNGRDCARIARRALDEG